MTPVINLSKGFGPSKAAKKVPALREGRPVASSTIIRWIVDGCVGPDGKVVRLEAVRLGARWVTDEDALQRFVERLTPKAESRTAPRPPTSRRNADERADRALRERGL